MARQAQDFGANFYDELVPLNVANSEQHVDEQPLHYNIQGRPAFSSVNLHLGDGQRVTAGAGKMQWMDSNLEVTTSCPQGVSGGCQRCCASETCCLNTFSGPGSITFGFDEPGDMLPFSVSPGNGWILTSKSFIVGTDNCVVAAKFPGLLTACCAGEGIFLTHVKAKDSRPAMFFAGSYGEIVRHDVPEGKTLLVDNGLFFAAHENTRMKLTIVGGVKTCCFGGEGFGLLFRGPTCVFTQSRDPKLFRRFGASMAASQGGGGGGAGAGGGGGA